MTPSRNFRVAVVGAGQAGQAHAFGFRNATMADRLAGITVQLATLVDPNTELATTVARRYGFEKIASDVQEVIDDPTIDVVSVALPSFLSLPVVGSLLQAGKHVITEKPLGRNGSEAAELADIAGHASSTSAVGFSYRRIPAVAQLRRAVLDGHIGTPYLARGQFFADYALDSSGPMVWRYDQEASGGGVILDMATHVLDALEFVLGPVTELTSADFDTRITERPAREGGTGTVTNDDDCLINMRFGDVMGTVLASRIAAGETINLGFEIWGSTGHVKYNFCHMNEFELYEKADSPEAEALNAPRIIQAGPASPHYLDVAPMAAKGNATGYGAAFIAEMQEFLLAIVTGESLDTSFESAATTMRVVDAAFASARTHSPVTLAH